MVLSHLRRRIKTEATDDLRREWNYGHISDSEFRRRMNYINRAPPGPYGEWWERAWFHSLPPEKGGAPLEPEIHQVGWNINIPLGFTPYWWAKRKIENVGDIWLSADNDTPEEAGPDPQRRDGRVSNDRRDHGKLQRPTPILNVERPYRWFEGGFYHLRFRPSVRFRPNEDLTQMIDEVSMRVQVELYSTHKQQHWGNVNFFVRYDISDKELFLNVQFEIITW
jgi:hypothetical protein